MKPQRPWRTRIKLEEKRRLAVYSYTLAKSNPKLFILRRDSRLRCRKMRGTKGKRDRDRDRGRNGNERSKQKGTAERRDTGPIQPLKFSLKYG